MDEPTTPRPRSPEEVRDFFSRWLGRSNAGDWDGLASMMHPQIEIRDPMAPEPARGLTAALDRAKGQYAPFPDGVVELLGDPFVALDEPELSYRWRFTGTQANPVEPPGFAATGLPVEVEGTSVLRFEQDKVIDVRMFFDSTEVARQLLAAPPAGSRLESAIALGQRVRVRMRRLRDRRRR
jgi:predicted ester cyclase